MIPSPRSIRLAACSLITYVVLCYTILYYQIESAVDQVRQPEMASRLVRVPGWAEQSCLVAPILGVRDLLDLCILGALFLLFFVLIMSLPYAYPEDNYVVGTIGFRAEFQVNVPANAVATARDLYESVAGRFVDAEDTQST